MFLITKIHKELLNDYRKEFLECLNHNASISEITKIIVFTDFFDNKISHPKVLTVFKKNLVDIDILEQSKRLSISDKIMLCEWDIKLYIEFYKIHELDLENNVLTSKNQLYIFKKSTKFGEINNSNLFYSIPLKNINFTFEKVKLPRKEIERVSTTSNNTIVRSTTSNNMIVRKAQITNKFSVEKITRNKKLDVIIISVNYNDYLLVSLNHNSKIFESITVVTSTDDLMCQEICKKLGVKCLITDVMYENGDSFNKGKAINYAIKSLQNPDLILLLDADMIITESINLSNLDDDTLYTSNRWICKSYYKLIQWKNGKDKSEVFIRENDKGYGFFQLFNRNLVPGENPFPENFSNAAMSDLLFRDKFTKRCGINVDAVHLGEIKVNWEGRQTSRFLNDKQFADIFNSIEISKKTNLIKIKRTLDKLPNLSRTIIKFSKNSLSEDKEPYIIHVTSTYITNDESTLRRIDFAKKTWKYLYENEKIIPLIINSKPSDKLPKVKDFFESGFKLCEKDDDIILYTNSDICLRNDTYQRIVESCKKWDCTFSFRKDFFYELNFVPEKEEIENTLFSGGIDTPHGADLFAVTKRWWKKNKNLIPNNQVIGRPTWDWIFRIAMEYSITENKNVMTKPFPQQGDICETPNISYHERHDSYWEKSENLFDPDSINNVKIAIKWMSDLSNNRNFTGKDYFLQTYGNLFDKSAKSNLL